MPRDGLHPIPTSVGSVPVDAGANGLEFRSLLLRSAQRGERAMGQAESRRGFRSGSSRHRFSEPHVQSSARNSSKVSASSGLWNLVDRALPRFKK